MVTMAEAWAKIEARCGTNHDIPGGAASPESADKGDPGLLPPFIAPLRLEESDCMKKARERILDFAGLHTGYCKSRVYIGQVKTMS